MMTDPETLALLKAASPAAIKIFSNAISRATRGLRGPAKRSKISILAALQGYSKYLDETHSRVATFKTFANPSEPVSVLDHFVDLHLEQRNSDKIDQTDIVKFANGKSKIVISASAGFGKSMLMRFLALCLYENPQGKIPIFVKLRHLNRIPNPDLFDYIHLTYRQHSDVQRAAFEKGLESGMFCFILDGFDELNHEFRPSIEEQILLSAKLYGKNSFIISGRPDERFNSWQSFKAFNILPMTKSQVVQLVQKLNYDKGTKTRFLTQVKSNLYDTHQSFLSTPLLAILMLLTYQQNANIPDKIHLFYNKAFETLFHKHEAMKEQYNRRRNSNLQIDDFAKLFSVFCLNSYVQEKTEFTRSEVSKYVTSAIAFFGLEVNAENVIFDMYEAVCLIQKEGLSYFFVHRSFQEYFTALFLANCPDETRDDFLERVNSRPWDNVLGMLYDMAAEQLEPSWIAKKCEWYLDHVGFELEKVHPALSRHPSVVVLESPNLTHIYSLGFSEFQKFIYTMRRFYEKEFATDKKINFSLAEETLAQIPGFKEAAREAPDERLRGLVRAGKFVTISLNEDRFPRLRECGLYERAIFEYDAIVRINRNITKDQKDRHGFLKSLFSKA